MTIGWYALRSKPRKEEALWGQLLARGFETFYPRLRINPVNPRARKLAPYFPGYMFVYADLEEVGPSTFNYMPFSLGLGSGVFLYLIWTMARRKSTPRVRCWRVAGSPWAV